jgi:hypothetical protein
MSDSEGQTEEMRTHKGYIQALTGSMQEQLERTKTAALMAEELVEDSAKCRETMISLAASYDGHLERLCDRLENSFQRLKREGKDELELIGETIAEIKLVKKKIISQQQRLAQKGLKILPVDYVLSPGESVVIVSSGELEGMTAKVISEVSTGEIRLQQNEVLVKPSSSLHAWDDVAITIPDPMLDRPLVLQRHELAIWEYDSVFDDSYRSKPATSISASKQKVNNLLATINSVSTKGKETPKKNTGKFQSSRARKAASKGKKDK